MIATTSYPLLEVFWTMLIFFAFVIWLWMLFVVIGDIFRRRDIGGWAKAAWIVVLIVLPYFGVFIYLIAEHTGLTERSAKHQQASEEQFAGYVKDVASESSPADQIARAKTLLDEGTIDAAEFDRIKQKALAA
ncbi:MAG TPA: PLDc N-terminal domain-containing protein [Solirubrobacteraceae bacterium]